MSKITLTSEDARQRLIGLVGQLDLTKLWEVEVRLKPKKRSLDQNSLLHRWFDIIAQETGDTPKSVKADLKNMFSPKVERVSKLTGKTNTEPKDTHEFTTKECVEFMDAVDKFCARDLGILLPANE